METLTPDTPVRYLKGVGPKTAERFEKLGIVTLADLLCHYPRRYLDFSKPYTIAAAPFETECVVKAEVFAKPGGRILPGGRRMERITAGDDVSSLEITWFNNPYAAQKLELGQEYYFQGVVSGGMLRRQMVNPQVRTEAQVAQVPFEAVYPQTEGLSSSAIAKCVRQLLPHAELLPDPLPEEMRKKYRLLSKAQAVRAIHCPSSEEEAFAARRRLIYEELLVLQLGIGRMKNHGAARTGAPMQRRDPEPFWASLPFSPTGAQRRAVAEILDDMAGETSMNRLLQGDVGSGKTLVAAAAIWACIRSGYQAALAGPHRNPGRPARRKSEPPAGPLRDAGGPFDGRDESRRPPHHTGRHPGRRGRPHRGHPRPPQRGGGVCPPGPCRGGRAAPLRRAPARDAGRKGREPPPAGHERHTHPPHAGAAPLRRSRHLHPRRTAARAASPVKTRCITGKKRGDLYGFLDRADRRGAAGVSGVPGH